LREVRPKNCIDATKRKLDVARHVQKPGAMRREQVFRKAIAIYSNKFVCGGFENMDQRVKRAK
jgi:hypothetical protein